MTRRAGAVLWLALGTWIGACTGVDDYGANTSRPYFGTVLGQTDPACDAGTGCSFLRRGFEANTELYMTFDPTKIDSSPGVVVTRGAGRATEACGTTFETVPLLAIEPVQHDVLSRMVLPGEGRLRTYLFSLEPTSGPLAARGAYAVVSLMREQELEVRIFSGSGRRDCAPTDCASFQAGMCDFFGVFHLKRRTLVP